MRPTPMERIQRRTVVMDMGWDTPCWLCDLGIIPTGYSQVSIPAGQRTIAFTHVYVWEQANGSRPPGMDVDHLCYQPACWRPDHLELVPHGVNVERGMSAAKQRNKTHCPKKHEYTPANTFVRQQHNKPGRYRRECRTCMRDRDLARKM